MIRPLLFPQATFTTLRLEYPPKLFALIGMREWLRRRFVRFASVGVEFFEVLDVWLDQVILHVSSSRHGFESFCQYDPGHCLLSYL